jgi:alkylation response protein AidB-like acyl-CoA dehydrogenase
VSVNNSLFCNGILKFGTEAQKQTYVRAIAEGREIGAFALTEPQSGSDATAMRCRAVKQADGSYVINGKKSWITSGPVAKYIVLFAMSDPDKGARGITAFMIDTDQARLPPRQDRAQARHPRLGHLRDRVHRLRGATADDVLGKEGEGFKIAMGVLDAGRIGIASQAVGLARAAYEATVAYVKERKAFGQPIGSFQMIQAKIADMKCKLDAATLLTLRAAWAKGRGDKTGGASAPRPRWPSCSASEAAMFITHQALQIHGGMGYSKEMPLERYFRDAKITEIYEGTSEIQRLVIARNETGLRATAGLCRFPAGRAPAPAGTIRTFPKPGRFSLMSAQIRFRVDPPRRFARAHPGRVARHGSRAPIQGGVAVRGGVLRAHVGRGIPLAQPAGLGRAGAWLPRLRA